MNIDQAKLSENIIKNKKSILIITVILIAFAVLFYVLVLSDDSGDKAPASGINTLPNIEQEKKLLKSYKFIRLESFLKEPVKIEAADTGRQNPFIRAK